MRGFRVASLDCEAIVFDRWTSVDAAGFALQGEGDFVPLRGPVPVVAPVPMRLIRALEAPTLAEGHALPAIPGRPGVREIGGRFFYSCEWL